MKEGEERLLVIPAGEGYGAKGNLMLSSSFYHYASTPSQVSLLGVSRPAGRWSLPSSVLKSSKANEKEAG